MIVLMLITYVTADASVNSQQSHGGDRDEDMDEDAEDTDASDNFSDSTSDDDEDNDESTITAAYANFTCNLFGATPMKSINGTTGNRFCSLVSIFHRLSFVLLLILFICY